MNVTILEDVFQWYVELAKVIFAESVMVPTNALQQRYANHWHLDLDRCR
jgi:hypothetical protein